MILIYATARDAGNYSAGYISGKKGLTWSMTRYGFDKYEKLKSGNSEDLKSKLSQKAGVDHGVEAREFSHYRKIYPKF